MFLKFKILILFALLMVSCFKIVGVPDDKNRITLWEQEDAQVAPFIDEIIAAFINLPENKDVTIRRVHYSTEDLTQQFQTASIAGSPPDLIMSPPDTAGVFSVSGFILSVNNLFDLSKYNQVALDSISLNKKTWGIPISSGNHLMLYYNRRFIKKTPQSMNDIFEFCEKELKKLKLNNCMAINESEPFWLMPWLGAFGGWPIDNTTPTLDTSAMRGALSFLVDLRHNKKFVPRECDYNCMDTLFKEEKVPFIINGDWTLTTYQNLLKENFAVTKIPKIDSTGKYPTPMISGKYFMLSSNLKDEKLHLAKRFIEFYTNKNNQIAQLRILNRLPALTEAFETDIIQKDPVLKASLDQVLYGKPMPMATEMRAIWDTLRPNLRRVLAKELTPEETAKKMQNEAVMKIQEMYD